MIEGKSFVGIKITASNIDETNRAMLRLVSATTRTKALKLGAKAALYAIRAYYNGRGRLPWINPSLPTHGPGRVPTGWWLATASGWSLTKSSGNSVTFANAAIGLAHKITGGTIRAKRRKFLTIPIVPQAHGVSARDYSLNISPLFRVKGVLAEKDDNAESGIRPVYVLKKSVTQKPWPGALPPEASYVDALMETALDHIERELGK
tara:strand:- start:1793 stop:2410 length:618 start_codon:yes stop_codon:yes gene_type:complete